MKNFKIYTRWIIFNEDKKFLLVEKNKTRKIAPWEALFPGGTVEFWEEIEETLKREIKEETNLELIKTKILTTKTMIIENTHWLWVYFLCETKNFDFKNMEPEKHTKVFWEDLEDVDGVWKEIILDYLK